MSKHISLFHFSLYFLLFGRHPICCNLNLGLVTKARGWKVAHQEGDLGVTSHVPGSTKSVREWTLTLTSELPCWELSPKRTPKSLERNCRGQKSSPWSVICIIGKLLKRKCQKWACVAHLDISNTSYGQKKGRESNWQFDSRPLKVGNRPNFTACRQYATYRRGLQLCFRPRCNWRSAQEIMNPQSCGSPSC